MARSARLGAWLNDPVTNSAGDASRAVPYVVLGIALLAVSNGAIFARLAVAPPLAIAAWRVGLALLVVLPLAFTAPRHSGWQLEIHGLRRRRRRLARRPFRDLDRLARSHDDRAKCAARQHLADLGGVVAVPRGPRPTVTIDSGRTRARNCRCGGRKRERAGRRRRAPGRRARGRGGDCDGRLFPAVARSAVCAFIPGLSRHRLRRRGCRALGRGFPH